MEENRDIRFLNTHDSLRKYYSNSKNNIEDPIFTGFTLDIDIKHSPLFFALCEDEYNESLRSPEGENIELSKKIEEKLEEVNRFEIMASPHSYTITTMRAKDSFGDNNQREIGYGIFNKIYLDDVQYGATDYIYMVDKVRLGRFSHDFGREDIGSGEPDFNRYQDAQDKITIEKDIFFKWDKYNINETIGESEIEKLNEIVDFLKNHMDINITLCGYASEEGETEHNMELSKNRVNSVKNYIISQEIKEDRINIHYFGESIQPYATLEKNRLVTCRVVDDNLTEESINNYINDANLQISDEENTIHNNNIKVLYGEKTSKQDVDTTIKTDNLINIDSEEINKLITNIDNLKEQIGLYGVYKILSKTIDELTSKIEENKNEVNRQKIDVKNELDDLKSKMSQYENILKTSDKGDVRDKINKAYEDFETFLNNIKTNGGQQGGQPDKEYLYLDGKYQYLNVKAKYSLVDKEFSKEIKNLDIEPDSEDLVYFKKIWSVSKTLITDISIDKDKVNGVLNKSKGLREKLEKQLYGSNGTMSKPIEGSIYYEYINAENTLKSDAASQKTAQKEEYEDIKNHLKDIKEYHDYLNPNTGDEEKDRELRESRQKNTPYERSIPTDIEKNTETEIYEVPQTVYDMLGFIRGMKQITNDYPYVLQSVTGLDEAYKNYFEVKDPYMGSGDGKITINCLEFLDLKVTSMFNKYFNAVYDRQYRRERVPINLRRFQCSIFVHDIRNFRDTLTSDIEEFGSLSKIAAVALNSLSAIEFKFFDCEIIPEETGNLFDNVSNNTAGDMRGTTFTFKYGNCVINFLPFEDLRRYLLDNKGNEQLVPKNNAPLAGYKDSNNHSNTVGPDGNFRRWFDKSPLGNVNNNDYRDYIRRDSSVSVDDYYKTTIVNNFAINSVVDKNKQLSDMDEALRKIVVGISASTGIPAKGVADSLNIGFIDPIINGDTSGIPVVKDLGMVDSFIPKDSNKITDLGNVNEEQVEESSRTARTTGTVVSSGNNRKGGR